MWRFTAAGVVLLTGALAASGPVGQAPASKLSRDWKRFSAVGLEVIGNAREGDLRTAARNIAGFRTTLQILMPGLRLSAPEPTTLVVFRDHPSFTEFAPRDRRGKRQLNIGGYFSDAPDRKYLVLPVFGDRRVTYETVFHEYTHYVVSRNFRDVPLWLSEGLAEFYSTFELDDEGRATVGKVPSSRVWTLSTERLRPLRALLGAESGSRQFGSTDAGLFYAQSWLFVHFMTLSDGGKRQGQIVRYLELLTETKSVEAAAREAFGTTLEALDRELPRYIEDFRLRGLRVSGVNAQMPTIDITPATEADVAETKARLLMELNVPSEAKRYITQALELDPAHTSGRITRARLSSSEGRPSDAALELDKICREQPQNFSAQYYLGRALYEDGRYSEAISAFDRAVKLLPEASTPWLQLSLAALALGQYEQSDSAMAQLQQLYSTPKWHYLRSYEAVKLGRFDAVLPDVKTFIDRAGTADETAPYAAFLGVIAARRLDRDAEATELLSRITPALPARSWPLTVAEYMQGHFTPAAFLSKADNNGQETEARTYIAFSLVDAGQRDEAKKHLQWVKDKGDRNYTEYDLAVAELKRLEATQ